MTLAARIGDWGEPGQVLVLERGAANCCSAKSSSSPRSGSAELKGLDEPVPLYRVLGQ